MRISFDALRLIFALIALAAGGDHRPKQRGFAVYASSSRKRTLHQPLYSRYFRSHSIALIVRVTTVNAAAAASLAWAPKSPVDHGAHWT